MCSFLWLTFHCVYAPQLLYPFICRGTSRLLPCPSYCKWCCSEHWGACVLLNNGFLSVYTHSGIHFIVQQKLTQHCKATTPQLKRKRQGRRNVYVKIESSKMISKLYFCLLKKSLGYLLKPYSQSQASEILIQWVQGKIQ